MATDEDILARSLQRARSPGGRLLYRPYRGRRGRATGRVLFRDHALSDASGSSTQSWEPEAAADDFVQRVREPARRFARAAGGEDATIVSVILDGENAWEHYEGGGRPFLRALYRRALGSTTTSRR